MLDPGSEYSDKALNRPLLDDPSSRAPESPTSTEPDMDEHSRTGVSRNSGDLIRTQLRRCTTKRGIINLAVMIVVGMASFAFLMKVNLPISLPLPMIKEQWKHQEES